MANMYYLKKKKRKKNGSGKMEYDFQTRQKTLTV